MASTIESSRMAGHPFQFQNVDRPLSARAPIQSAGFRVGNTSWEGIPNIWSNSMSPGLSTSQARKEPSGQSSERLPSFGSSGPCLTSSLVSPSRNDRLTRPRDPNITSLPASRGSDFLSSNGTTRHASNSEIPITASNGRTLMSRISPPRQRPELFQSPPVPEDFTLSNAALLTGSAPDVGPNSPRSFGTFPVSELGLRGIDMATINEFVPAPPDNQSNRHWQEPHSRRTDHLSAGASQILRPLNRPRSNHHTLGSREPGQLGTLRSFPIRSSDAMSSQAPRDDWRLQASAHDGLYHMDNGISHDPEQNLVSQLGNVQLIGSPDNKLHARFSQNVIRDSALVHRHNPGRSCLYLDTDIANHGCMPPAETYSTPAQSGSVSDSNMLSGMKMAAASSNFGDPRSAFYTPSLTPSTMTDSQRSASGSGTSAQETYHGVEPRHRNFESSVNAFMRNGPYQTPLSHLPPECYSYSAPMVAAYNSHQTVATVAPESSSQEGRLDLEKEQNLSAVLKDFRANHKTKRYELKDVYNHIVEFSGDQHGSRFIQGKLETANSDEKEQVFAEIKANTLQLMTDIFGNYVIQKLFEHGTQAQKKHLASQMEQKVLYLTTQVYGCRVVQKALEHVLVDQQARLVKELDGHVLEVVENQNGNHVIQKAIERVPGEHIQFIFDAHKGQIVRLSKHNYGCRVVQRMLEHGQIHVKRGILSELQGSIPTLIEDQFGNYVMQHIIRFGEPADQHRVVTLVQHQLLHFSKHKFASNVVETAIECAVDQQRQDILRKLTTGVDQYGQSQVYGLIRDQFGNYVIQKVLSILQGAALEALIQEIRSHLAHLRKISHGKQVAAMEKAIAEASARSGPFHLNRTSPMAVNSTMPSPRPALPNSNSHGHFSRHNLSVVPRVNMHGTSQ